MPYSFDSPPFGHSQEDWLFKGTPMLAKQIFRAAQFIRGLRFRMRYGEISRAPLRLLRFQILENTAECDWMARFPDPWDVDLTPKVQQRHITLQALKDAIDVRALLFETLPDLDSAQIHVYRESSDVGCEVIITGFVQRNDNASRNLHSIVMRARVLGFRFEINEERLQKISPQEKTCVEPGFGN